MIKVTYRFHCCASENGIKCRSTSVMAYEMHFGAEPQKPELPKGWLSFENLIYCLLHRVSLTIKSKRRRR